MFYKNFWWHIEFWLYIIHEVKRALALYQMFSSREHALSYFVLEYEYMLYLLMKYPPFKLHWDREM